MTVKLLTEQHFELLILSSSEPTLVKIPHCWKSHATAHMVFAVLEGGCSEPGSIDNGEYTVYTDMDPTLSGSIYNTQYRIGSSVSL